MYIHIHPSLSLDRSATRKVVGVVLLGGACKSDRSINLNISQAWGWSHGRRRFDLGLYSFDFLLRSWFLVHAYCAHNSLISTSASIHDISEALITLGKSHWPGNTTKFNSWSHRNKNGYTSALDATTYLQSTSNQPLYHFIPLMATNISAPPTEGDSSTREYSTEPQQEEKGLRLPSYKHRGHKICWSVRPEGESGRSGIQPIHFFKIIWKSSCLASQWVNVLWPFVPTAMALFWARPEQYLWIFITSYIAMVPAANLIGFAGSQLAQKLPKVLGVVLETTLGSIVEIILFMVLLKHYNHKGVSIIQAAILGSILANLLLCLGMCFYVGGLFREDQTFHDAVSDTGSNLMLVAGSKFCRLASP